jgi:pimeloyl-ACP methyl ester carboxylesterase
VPPNVNSLSINGLRLQYLEWGAAPRAPVVLLHGGSAHAHWWDLFAAAIADSYHVLALDLRGHGDSEHADPTAYQVDDYARDLAAFITSVGLSRIHLIGHSLGAMIATAFANEHPRQLRSVVIVDSQLRITPAGARYMLRLRNFPQPVYRDRQQAIERFRLLPTQTAADQGVLRDVAAQSFRELSDGRWTLKFDRAALGHHAPQDLTPVLRQLTCPILLVRGAHSTLLSPSALAALRAAAPQAAVAEVPAAHHHVMLDNPAEFERVVRAFLDTANRDSPAAARPPAPWPRDLEPSNR